jgi:Zn-finger nucleic acid-binding protein
MCGAPASTETTRCEHCGARLATVACPSCFGMMFVGEKFCSHCGAKAERRERIEAPPQKCPRCRVDMNCLAIGPTHVRECPRCQGLWVDADSLEQICTDREKQAAVLGTAIPSLKPPPNALEQVRYVPCPVCQRLMNRVNFAHCSNVVVDVCKGHGTWFDRDELQRILDFIRAGGLEACRAKRLDEPPHHRATPSPTPALNLPITRASAPSSTAEDWKFAITATADLLKTLFGR